MSKPGTGEGKDYVPYISTAKLNSLGTTSVIKDWKTGRGVHCMSQGEAYWYYILRWDDDNIDIREQYPMNKDETTEIAIKEGIQPAKGGTVVMTTDFLATRADGTLHAYSVKPNRDLDKRTMELLCVEKMYWNNRGVPYTLLFKTDVNRILVGNIRRMVEFFDAEKVFDLHSAIKHKIAIKEYGIDMTQHTLTTSDIERLLEIYE